MFGSLDPTLLEEAEARSRTRYRRAGLTAAATVGARGIAAVTALVTPPLALPYLGSERFGVWATISSFAALLAFTDLGIGNSLLTLVARATGHESRTELRKTTATGVGLLVAIGLALGMVVFAVYRFIDWNALLSVRDPVARGEVADAILAFGLCFAASVPLAAVTSIRQGFQEGYLNNAFVAAGNIASLGLIVLAIQLRLGLPWLVAAFMAAPLMASAVNGIVLAKQRPDVIPNWQWVDRAVAASLIRSGSQFMVLQLAMAGAFYADTLIAAGVLGPGAAAQYSIASLLFLIPTGAAAAALSPLWPAYAEATARGDSEWVTRTLRRSVIIAVVVTTPVCALIVALAHPIQELWLGGAVVAPGGLVLGVGVWTVLRAVGHALAMFLNGLHLLKVQVITAVVMAPLNVLLTVWLAGLVGVEGVILGSLIAYPLATLIPIAIYLPNALGRISAGGEVIRC